MATLLSPSPKISRDIRDEHLLPELQVNHTRNTPVFIIGQPRSGTSVFARMFRKYLKVNFGPESQFFIRMNDQLERFGDLEKDENLRTLIAEIARERCFQRNQFNFAVDTERVFRETPERTYPAVVATIFSHFAEHNGLPRWGDKTPEYIENLETLHLLFPDAQYIHIVRDGRDVALSHFKTHFGAKNSVVAALEWQLNVDRVLKFAAKLPADRFTEIRYEDLMETPEAVFRHLIGFLGIEDAGDELGRFIEENIEKEFKKQNYFKWQKAFSRRAKRDFERVAKQGLEWYRYPTVTQKKPLPMTLPEKVFWKGAHLVKKALQISYWRDNLYKSGLRWRRLGLNRA